VVGLVHDAAQSEGKLTKVVSIGLLTDAITIRATDEAHFSVHDLIHKLHKELSEAFVEGGGHKNAGSIKFVPNKQAAVLALLKEYIKSLH
jgi:RecJ-like exonuclease